MSRTDNRRRQRLGTGLVLCLALSTAGCDTEGGSGAPEPGLKKAPEASAGVVPAEGLAGASLAPGDVDGYAVKAPAAGDVVGPEDVRVTDAACAPVAYALAGTVAGKPSATEVRHVVGGGVTTTVVLATHDETATRGDQANQGDPANRSAASAAFAGSAEAVLESLSESADDCASGFTATVSGAEWRVTDVTRRVVPEGADQALGLGATLERDEDGDEGDVERASAAVVVLRRGSTVAHVSSVGEGGRKASGRNGDGVPVEVVNAQLARLT
ncbi:hypothetical protein WBG99_23155 [Streptomyces sp. TG1A-60]|uniref:hypothetical protein n=1 Tax=Streptomyces sp. TG1A-60 TaxID=3129111 RepID=UPI0030D13139